VAAEPTAGDAVAAPTSLGARGVSGDCGAHGDRGDDDDRGGIDCLAGTRS
jgi:hypothetical protein